MIEYFLYSDEDLMRELRAGNMLAFDALYKKYSGRLYKFGISLLKSEEETENLIQEVFIALWLNRNVIEKETSLKSYIFSVTHNSAISMLRKKLKEARFVEYLRTVQIVSEPPVDRLVEYNELSKRLDEIIKNLPQRQKEVFLLHKMEGLQYNKIAEQLNISINTVENHMSHALKTIREKFGNSILLVAFISLFL